MNKQGSYALPKENLILMAVGFVIIILGFVCMIGGGSEDGVSFNPEIFSPMRITVAPIIVMIGFSFEIFAILWIRPSKDADQESGLMVADKRSKEVR